MAVRRYGAAAVADRFRRPRAGGPGRLSWTARSGAVWSVGGTPRVVFDFVVRGGHVTGITLLADPEVVSGLDLVV